MGIELLLLLHAPARRSARTSHQEQLAGKLTLRRYPSFRRWLDVRMEEPTWAAYSPKASNGSSPDSLKEPPRANDRGTLESDVWSSTERADLTLSDPLAFASWYGEQPARVWSADAVLRHPRACPRAESGRRPDVRRARCYPPGRARARAAWCAPASSARADRRRRQVRSERVRPAAARAAKTTCVRRKFRETSVPTGVGRHRHRPRSTRAAEPPRGGCHAEIVFTPHMLLTRSGIISSSNVR